MAILRRNVILSLVSSKFLPRPSTFIIPTDSPVYFMAPASKKEKNTTTAAKRGRPPGSKNKRLKASSKNDSDAHDSDRDEDPASTDKPLVAEGSEKCKIE